MEAELGEIAVKIIENGELVDHDFCRFYMQELEKALDDCEQNHNSENRMDIVVNAVSYTNLITRHAQKENTVVFPFADRSLSAEKMEQISKESLDFENQYPLKLAFSFLN